LDQGVEVYGVGRNFSRNPIVHKHFNPVCLDLSDTHALSHTIGVLASNQTFHYLVNGAGIGAFRPHEEIDFSVLSNMIDVNLKAPILLTHLLLRGLKQNQGYIFNITSIEATRHSKFSATYTASKSGLKNFGLSLFEEVRSSGVKVVTLHPDMTQTPFFEQHAFDVGKSPDTYLTPDMIVHAIDFVLKIPPHQTLTEMTLRPQRFGITKKGKTS
jgi:short-subunit dehydrogenase